MESNSENRTVTFILSGVKPTKSVVCAILAFLEAVEEDLGNPDGASSLRIVQGREVKGNGIAAQGRRVPKHIAKFGLPVDNFAGDKSGRKTPQVNVVIPRLVEYLESHAFDTSEPSAKVPMLHAVSEPFRAMLGLSLGGIRINPAGMSAAAVIEEVLSRAKDRGVDSAIAELLVGSKLEVCVDGPYRSNISQQHKWENGHDDPDALGDYRIDNVAMEVTMVASPDETHRTKANKITASGTDECWLIVRSDKIKAWQDYIARAPSKYPKMIRCYGICEFIGQNSTEARWRSCVPNSDPLRDIIAKLNELVARFGSQFLPAAQVELIG